MNTPNEHSEALDLIPVAKGSTTESASSSQEGASISLHEGFLTFIVVAIVVLVVVLVVVGARHSLDILLSEELRKELLANSLQIATYVFLTLISAFCGFEVNKVIQAQHKKLRRPYFLILIVSGMLAYALFYMHLTFDIYPKNTPTLVIGIASLIGLAFGWFLPGAATKEPYGTIVYLMLLVLLVAFTWLARLVSVPTYGWVAFAMLLAYFARLAFDGIAQVSKSTVCSLADKAAEEFQQTEAEQIENN